MNNFPLKIDKYEIIEEIGRGGMAIVYKALHPFLEKYVAIKVLPEYFVHQNPEFVERFTREAKTMMNLKHPNIVRIYDAGVFQKIYFIVMEYIQGKTLKDLIIESAKLKKNLDIDLTINIIMQVADALSYAHDHNVIHRDIKPSNILFEEESHTPYITDFGIAKAVLETKLTKSGVSLGTPEYMSPEQFLGKEEIDKRTDIYSLGVVFYEMLTGEVPFKGDTPLGVAFKHVNTFPTKPRILNPKVSPYLEKLVLKMLAKSPDDRYQSMKELKTDLELLKNGNFEKMLSYQYVEENKCKVTLNSDPIGAKVYIDGNFVGLTPISDFEISSGVHKIFFFKNEYEEFVTEINIAPGDNEIVVNATLKAVVSNKSQENYEFLIERKSEEKTDQIQSEESMKSEGRFKAEEEKLEEVEKLEGLEQKTEHLEQGSLVQSEGQTVSVSKVSDEATKLIVQKEAELAEPKQKKRSKLSKIYFLVPVILLIGTIIFASTISERQNSENVGSGVSKEEPVYVSIFSDPSGATVLIDGKNVGFTNVLNYAISEGNHSITLKKDGYEEKNDKIQVSKNGDNKFSYSLTKITPAEVEISIESNPDNAKVYLDEKFINYTPIYNYKIIPGTYVVKVTKDGYKDYSETIVLSGSDGTKKLLISLQKKEETNTGSTGNVVTIKTGTISISSNPSGAKVYINNSYKGITPINVTLKEGKYNVKLTKEGYMDYINNNVSVVANKKLSLECSLIKIKEEAEGEYFVHITSTPVGASVYLDGKYIGDTPIFFFKVNPGSHTLLIKKTGYLGYTTSFVILESGGKQTSINAALIKTP
ncbi:MAG: serine/threonine-protein kinase [Candidatus Aenigmatarchaeota archaeon]